MEYYAGFAAFCVEEEPNSQRQHHPAGQSQQRQETPSVGSKPNFTGKKKSNQRKCPQCQLCKKEGHFLAACKQFKTMKIDDRLQFCCQKRTHFGCLSKHPAGQCKVPENQRQCTNSKDCPHLHHHLLHGGKQSQPSKEEPTKKGKKQITYMQKQRPSFHTSLKVVKLFFRPYKSRSKAVLRAEAIVDHRSIHSMIEQETLQRLQCKNNQTIYERVNAFEVSKDGRRCNHGGGV